MSDGNVGLPPKWKRKLTLTLDTTDALTDPIPEDEEDREDHSEASSSDQKEKVASHRMEDDIESQRALSGNGASTSSIEPTKGKPEDDGDTKEKVSTVIEGEVQISDRPKTDDDIESQQHSDYARRDGQMGVTQKETPSCSYSNDPSLGDTGSSETSTCKKERSSWEYKADDSFKFESGAISEPDKPPGPQPILAPPFVRNKNDFRAKLMHLSDLTLPPSPSGPEPELPELPPLDNDQEQSPIDSVVGDLPLLTSRKKPPRPNFGRPKTRLQDPPPITPAVSDQLASIWSEPASRSRRSSLIHQPVDDDGQTARFGPVTSRRVSISMKDSEADQLGMRRKSVILNAADSGTGPAPAPPAAAPSRLGMFSPSVLFSPSRLGLLSKSKANIQPPPVEEEVDPLDDDSIPKYKKYKKQERRWLVWIQWIGLFLLIVILILAIKLHALQMVMWKQIMLWQWLALALVIVSGRLIAGWCVMILVALIERHYILKKRVLYFVYGLRHAVKNCVWLALVIGVWKLVFRHVESKANVPIVTKVLWCLFTTSCLWMVKILAVKVAANSFHRAAYFDRVQDCLFHQYVLETLSAPRADDSHWELDSGRSQLTELPPDPPASSAPNPVLEPQRSPDKQREPTANLASGTSRTNLGIPSPSTSNLNNIASPSRSNLGQRVPSRANLGGALPRPQASQLMSPGGRRRRVSILNTGTDGTQLLARSPLPIEQEKLQELTSETVSAWTLKKLMKMIRKTNIATFSSILDQEAGERIDSEAQAKAASKQIFYNIARPGERFLTLNDFLYFLPEDQATRAFGLFEVNDLGHITKKALMKWVVNIYKERRALALTLSDNRTVVAKLHRVLDVLLLAVAVTICLLIMGVNTQKLIVGFSSVLLPAVFVFGNAARSTFESLIFLFVMHPFDVGDRINVDGIAMIVEEMNILNTIFLSGSNEKIYYPNSILATKAISNYYRSPDQWDSIEFQIHASTAVEQLGLLKERMTKYIESLPQFWYPVFRIVCKDIEDSTRMKMALWVQHHLNYQESGERWQRRSNMILHMKTQLQDLGIGYHLPRQEITVTGVPVLDVPPPHHCYPTPI